jgi:hypothetical protein
MKLIPILLVILIVASCNSNSRINQIAFKNLTTDTFFRGLHSSETLALNLSQIDEGVDSFELRVWHGISIVRPKYLIILKYKDSRWILNETTYWVSYNWKNGSPESAILDSLKTKSLPIQPSISKIAESIINFRLDTFPSQSEIPGFVNNVADGFFYDIELATSKYYKYIIYHNPNRYNDPYDRKITTFLSSLSEIGVWNIFQYGL